MESLQKSIAKLQELFYKRYQDFFWLLFPYYTPLNNLDEKETDFL